MLVQCILYVGIISHFKPTTDACGRGLTGLEALIRGAGNSQCTVKVPCRKTLVAYLWAAQG